MHVCGVNLSPCVYAFVFLVCHPTSVPVQLLQTAAVMCHCEPWSDWPDELAETADNYSGGSAHAGYQRFRSEPHVKLKWSWCFPYILSHMSPLLICNPTLQLSTMLFVWLCGCLVSYNLWLTLSLLRCRYPGRSLCVLDRLVYAPGYSGEEGQLSSLPICLCGAGETLANICRCIDTLLGLCVRECVHVLKWVKVTKLIILV